VVQRFCDRLKVVLFSESISLFHSKGDLRSDSPGKENSNQFHPTLESNFLILELLFGLGESFQEFFFVGLHHFGVLQELLFHFLYFFHRGIVIFA